MIEVDYEKLVTNQEAESRRLSDFIDIEWDDACLAFYNKQRRANTASDLQVKNRCIRVQSDVGNIIKNILGRLSRVSGTGSNAAFDYHRNPEESAMTNNYPQQYDYSLDKYSVIG